MKRLFFTLTALAALTLASCSKDRTCTCTFSSGGFTSDAEVVTIVDATKGQAKANCIDLTYPDGDKQDCELN